MEITINYRKVFWFLTGMIVMFVLLQFYNMYQYMIDIKTLGIGHAKFIRLIDLDTEANLPTLFSVLQLILASLLLYVISRIPVKNMGRTAWLGLSGVFFFLAVDEGAAIHEKIGTYFKNNLLPAETTDGLFYFAWMIPYLFLLIIFGIVFFRFLLNLPWKYSRGFIISGVIFILGAIVIESKGSLIASQGNIGSVNYCLAYTAEETCEMFGITLFIKYLMMYIQEYAKNTINISVR